MCLFVCPLCCSLLAPGFCKSSALHTQCLSLKLLHKNWISPSFVVSSALELQLRCKPLFLMVLLILQRFLFKPQLFPGKGFTASFSSAFGSSLICSSSAFRAGQLAQVHMITHNVPSLPCWVPQVLFSPRNTGKAVTPSPGSLYICSQPQRF